jgi:hypothetical protein
MSVATNGRADPTTVDAEQAALEWLMADCPREVTGPLAQALASPVALQLTGPGGGIWTREVPNPIQFEL